MMSKEPMITKNQVPADVQTELKLHAALFGDKSGMIARTLAEIERLQADHKRMNALDESGRRWTFWVGKSEPRQLTTMAVQPYESMRHVIDSFYGLGA